VPPNNQARGCAKPRAFFVPVAFADLCEEIQIALFVSKCPPDFAKKRDQTRGMKTPLILFSISVAVVVAVLVPGSPLDEIALFGGLLSATAAFLLLLLAALREETSTTARLARAGRRNRSGMPVLVDGSNVMYWAGGKPDLGTVKLVVKDLQRQGYAPTVWFDANAGYLMKGAYMGPKSLARPIGLGADQVCIAPRGTPADPLILKDAKTLRAPIVTNDRFRDWAEIHPYMSSPGVLRQGRIARGTVELAMC